MKLPGRLSATTLGDLLGILCRGRATGVLELVETGGVGAGRRHRVHVDAGLVSEVDSPLNVPRLGEILRREGFLDDRAMVLLTRRLAAQPDKRAGRILLEAGLSSRSELAAALREQRRARLERVFQIEDALIQFHVARPRLRLEDRQLPLSPHEFLHGRPRRRDQGSGRRAEVDGQATGRDARAGVEGRARRRRALSVLGLSEAADRETVQRAFRRLAGKLHPDRYPGASGQELASLMRGFSQLTAAYHELVA